MGRNDRQWLDKLTGIVRENLTCETLSVDLLTEKMALSRSSLQRKLKGLTGVSPNEYIQLVRLKTAAQLLRSGEYRISEVCYLTGFSSMSWFAKCFTKQFGHAPEGFHPAESEREIIRIRVRERCSSKKCSRSCRYLRRARFQGLVTRHSAGALKPSLPCP